MNKPQERQIKHIKDVFPSKARPNGLTSGPSVPTKRPPTYQKRTAPRPPSAPAYHKPLSATSAVFGPRTTANPLVSESRDRTAPPNGTPVGARAVKSDELNATVSSVSHSGSSGYQSDRDVVSARSRRSDDDDGFGEDECTLTFDDEDDAPAEGRFKSVYDEYQGEDFARYLDDDDDVDAAPALPLRQYTARPHSEVAATPAQIPRTDLAANSTKGRLAKRGLKERLRGLFTLTRSGRKSAGKQREPVSNIFDFTYTDSKIGCNDLDDPVVSDAAGGTAERKSWWSKNTLSARSMSSNSDVMFTSRAISQSTPDIYDAVSFASAGDYGNGRVRTSAADSDFESYRKSTLYTTNNNGGNVGKKCKRKTTLFQKLSNSLRRLDKADREAIESYAEEYERSGSNVVVNPLTALPPDENTYM